LKCGNVDLVDNFVNIVQSYRSVYCCFSCLVWQYLI